MGERRLFAPSGRCSKRSEHSLYSSHMVEWQRTRDVDVLSGLAPKHRKRRSAAEREVEGLRRRNAKLEDQLARHRVALEAHGQASELSWRSCWRRAFRGRLGSPKRADAVIEERFAVVEPLLGTKSACAAVGRARASHYRRRTPHHQAQSPALAAEQAQ